MLQAEKITKSYFGESLFEEASFTMQKGEKCALLGRNGSGKTTLLKILKGEEEPDSGRIILPKGYRLGHLEQHSHFSASTVLEEALKDLPPEKQEAPHEVEKVLFGLGFDEEGLEKAPSSLSGGFHLRLKLAKVLCSEPDCFLLDEPTNYLDIVTMRWLQRFLKNWKGECIIISHDREFLDSLVTHTMGIHRKKLKKIPGDTEAYFLRILEEEETYEKTRVNLEKKRQHAEDYIKRFGAKASKASQAQSRVKALARMPTLAKLASIEDLSFTFHYTPFSGKKMLSAQSLHFSYTPELPLIQDVSLEIEKGKRIAIIGKNGMGKSTLLKLISGDLAPWQGSVTKSDQARLGYFGQTNIDRLSKEKTIEEEIGAANPLLNYTQVRTICGQMMFSGDAAKKKISVLSGGERSRVLLGKILASPSNLLLLDEPTHHLDVESIEALIEAIDAFEGSVIIVTHSEWILERIEPDQLIVFQGGVQTHFLGSYTEFLEKEGWEESASSKQKKIQHRENDKSKRAELVQERSKQLKPLQNEIQSLEKAIELKEQTLRTKEALLIEASNQSHSSQIIELSQIVSCLQQEIESDYQQLGRLYSDFEKKKGEFTLR
jgi:ATP-binding cassette, subfamily F, member 3